MNTYKKKSTSKKVLSKKKTALNELHLIVKGNGLKV